MSPSSSGTTARIDEYRRRNGEFGKQPHLESELFDDVFDGLDAYIDSLTARPAPRTYAADASRNPLSAELQAEWHPSRNGSLHADMVTAGTNRKVWWMCASGHEWESEIKSRSRGIGCPFCEGRREPLTPGLVAEWHPTLNGSLTADRVRPGSTKKVWWQCAAGHEWQATVLSRSNSVGCPTCSGRQVPLSPELVAEWHPTRNYDISPDRVTAGSMVIVWWRCAEGHDWQARVYSRARTDGTGRGCPVCYGRVAQPGVNDLATVDPVLSAEWHPSLNGLLTPRNVLPRSRKIVWWRCRSGHEWQARVRDRSQGIRCPVCFGSRVAPGENDLATVNPALASEWHPTLNVELTPNQVRAGSGKFVWWRCSAGHEWTGEIRSRNKGGGCPTCAGRKKPGRLGGGPGA